MKSRFSISALLTAVMLLAVAGQAEAQSRTNPSGYMEYITERYDDLSVKFYEYMSAIAHSSNAGRIEKQRAELLELSWDTYNEVRTMPPFKGNIALRDSAAAFMKINHFILKNDYDKILELEAVSRDSYSEMEAYILAQRAARNRLDAANVRMLAEQKRFAAEFDVELVQRTDAVFRKMRITNEVLRYLDDVYLAFFRSHIDETDLLEYLKDENRERMRSGSEALLSSCVDGLEYLRTLEPPNGDYALQNACAELLRFYSDEARGSADDLLRYRDAESAFRKVKSEYDALDDSGRDVETVREYNDAVRQLNYEVDTFNEVTKKRNERREALLVQWQEAFDKYLASHIPKF